MIKLWIIYSIFTISSICRCLADDPVVHYCDEGNSNNSDIYCYGRILNAVQLLRIFPDSKEFVDMPLKTDPQDVLRAFDKRFPHSTTDKLELAEFVGEHFATAGSDLDECDSADWKQDVGNFAKIKDRPYRDWAQSLHRTWLLLCKRVNPSVKEHQDRHSLLYVPYPFIVPGGRFREFYYWDTFFTIKGLLVSEMYDTVRLQLLDLVYFVEKHGLVPNGGRVYYLKRSQPPLLIPMVDEYYQATKNASFLRQILPSLKKEFSFWERNRTVSVVAPDGAAADVFYFRPETNQPRPESYYEDYLFASLLLGTDARRTFWRNIGAAAESGRDFSSRWLADGDSMLSIQTQDVVPVDLNAMLCANARHLASFYTATGDTQEAAKWTARHRNLRAVIKRVFWNETAGVWFDYHRIQRRHITQFYPSVVTPFLFDCHHADTVQETNALAESVLGYLNDHSVLSYPGGIPSSLLSTGEQWDFPNGWPPENHWIIGAFSKAALPEKFKNISFNQADKLLQTAYRTWKKTDFMWEKYNVNGTVPKPGAGGEYDVQKGFGWTNGVMLDLLFRYGDRLVSPPTDAAKPSAAHRACQTSWIVASVILLRSVVYFI